MYKAKERNWRKKTLWLEQRGINCFLDGKKGEALM